MSTAVDLDELLGELPDIKPLISSLECAETVETIEDFNTNVADALDAALALVEHLRDLKRRSLR